MLIVIPWSTFWDRNAFAESMPALQAFLLNGFVRGAVSGIGLINVWAGLMDLAVLLSFRAPAARATAGTASVEPDPPTAEFQRPAREA